MKYPVGTKLTKRFKGETQHAIIVGYNERHTKYMIEFSCYKGEFYDWSEKGLQDNFKIQQNILPEDLFEI